MTTRRRITVAVSFAVLLSCLVGNCQAWLEQKTEVLNESYNGFKLRNSQRALKTSKKDSKDAKYETNDSKSSKSGYGYYDYYYPGDAGFLDEDIAGDFEDIYGYIVTADHFSYPHYTPSKKSNKSSKSDYHYNPGMSYPLYEQGKGGGSGKKVKLPYYDPHLEVGRGKGSKGGPHKLTRPPSYQNAGPPGGPPALQGSPDDPDSPDEPDGPESAAPTSVTGLEPSTPTPTSSDPGAPTQSEEPTSAPQIGGNETEAPTVSLNGTEPVDVTKSLIERVSFSLYSLTYDIEDNKMPSREEDIPELTAVTRSVFKSYMEKYFEEFPLSILVGFETEFVRWGVNSQHQLYVVYRSSALFDKASFVIPEAEQLELTLQEALQGDETLWTEYIAALQELNPDNAFSETISVSYAADPPPTTKQRASVGDSTSAVAAIAVAAAGLTVVAIGLFVLRRKRKASLNLDGEEGVRSAKRSLFRSNAGPDSDTGSDTFNASIEGLQTVPLTSTVGSTAEVDEENGSVANCSSVYTSREQSTKADDWSKYRTYSCDQNESDDDCSEYSDDAIATRAEDGSSESKSLIEEKSQRNSRKLHPWQEAPSIERSLRTRNGERELTPKFDSELTERQRGGMKSLKAEAESSEHKKQEATQRSQEEARKLQEKKNAVEHAALEDWLRKEKMARLEEEKRLSEEKHQAELAKIEAEEAARVAQELRAKEEQRFAAEKEAFEVKLNQKEKARQYEEKKLLVAKANFEAMIRKEKETRKALELRLIQEKIAADESLKKALERAQIAEHKIKLEQRKLNKAKKAMEAKQKQYKDEIENPAFSQEEENYLRQMRAAEAAREENQKASNDAARASDIRKLQQLRFEEKGKDLEALRMREAEAAKRAEEKVKEGLTAEESLIWDQAMEISQSPAVASPDPTVDGDKAIAQLAMALRLAQSWEENIPTRTDEDDGDGEDPQVLSYCGCTSEKAGSEQQSSIDDAFTPLSRDCDDDGNEKDVETNHDVDEPMDKEPKENAQENDEMGDSTGGAGASVVTSDAIAGTQQHYVETTQKGEASSKPPQVSSLPGEGDSIRTNLVIPEALRRRLGGSITVIPKIGPAQFIAPWNERDEARKKASKSRNFKAGDSSRAEKKSPARSDDSIFSESAGSNVNGSSIKSTATPASVDDDDTCSEFSLRTSTTLSSGFSKILPR